MTENSFIWGARLPPGSSWPQAPYAAEDDHENFWYTCLYLLGAGITGMDHHVQFI